MAKVRKRRSTASPSPADKPPPSLTLKLPPEQAEALRKLALPPGAIRKLSLPPEQAEALRKLALPPEQAEAGRKFAKRMERAAREQSKLDEARKIITRHLAIRDGLLPPPWLKDVLPAAPQPAKEPVPLEPLPTMRPKNIGPKVWLVAKMVLTLVREGESWINLPSLLDKVQVRIRKNVSIRESISMRTLTAALQFLRRGRHIDC